MTDWVPWFRYQLKASADGFEWAFSQIPSALHELLPPEPDYMGTWPPARHVWHVAEYERSVVIPTMGQWLGGALARAQNGFWYADDNDEVTPFASHLDLGAVDLVVPDGVLG